MVCALCVAHAHGQDLAQAKADREVEKTYKQGERAYKNGAYNEAINLFTHVLQADGDHMNAYLQRGFCHSLKREYAEAVTDFSAVIERKPDHTWAYISRGSAYNKLNEHAKAMSDFDAVLALDPKNQEAYNNRGWSKKAMGDADGACADWKQSKRLGNSEAAIILKNNPCK